MDPNQSEHDMIPSTGTAEPVTDPVGMVESVQADPELVGDITDVLRHLGSFVFDPTGQPAE